MNAQANETFSLNFANITFRAVPPTVPQTISGVDVWEHAAVAGAKY